MKRLIVCLLLLSACKEAKEIKEKMEPEPTPSSDARLLPSPVEVTPEPTLTPQPTVAPSPTATPSPTPVPTPHPLTGTWRYIADPNIVFYIGVDGTGGESFCQWSFEWTEVQTNASGLYGEIYLSPLHTGSNANGCIPTNGPFTQNKYCSWSMLNNQASDQVSISCLYNSVGQGLYERVP
jgi:hypothetical protein